MSEPEIWLRVYRATLDTNIFLRALIRKGNVSDRILELWQTGRFVLVLSQAILDEIRDVLLRPSLLRKYHYSPEIATQLIDLLTQRAIIVDVPFSLELCRDPNDDPFIDCAVLGRVHFLVSYDNDLLAHPQLRGALFEFGVEIVSPPAFVERIREAETETGGNQN